MKGTSLKIQIESAQKEVNEVLNRFPEDEREKWARYICQFYVQELPNRDAYMGRNTFFGRFEMYCFDKEKFEMCKKFPYKELNCKDCKCCGVWDIDGHFKIPCCDIEKITTKDPSGW